MSVEATKIAWQVPNLSPAQKAVLVALADHADSKGRNAFPSVALLCEKTCYAERTIRRALKELRELELIIVMQESTQNKPTAYYLDLPEMQVWATQGCISGRSGVPENTARGARNAPEPSLTINEPSTGHDDDFADICKVYESEIGGISKLISDQIEDSLTEFSATQIKEAIEIAAKNNIRKWAYVDGILKRWRANGYKPDKKAEEAVGSR